MKAAVLHGTKQLEVTAMADFPKLRVSKAIINH